MYCEVSKEVVCKETWSKQWTGWEIYGSSATMSSTDSNFEEKLGVIISRHAWGRWWQTLEDVQIEVDLPEGTRAKQLKVDIRPSFIELRLQDKDVFKGPLFGIVHADESTWTIEQSNVLRIILPKANYSPTSIFIWKSLLKEEFPLDESNLQKTLQKLELERLKVENPAYDFSKFKQIIGGKVN
ncbi:unnamed protein product [Allacma fusca]|uniref:CS domain-containing protein n=1 Tax=Allacma fusca TaxID=39272 RepID=A0A8J2KNB9_9HEXA|nr:unnamed protein product [Allacma fusca]